MDPSKDSVVIHIWPNYSKVCPVTAMSRFVLSASHNTGSLFQFSDGSFLTRNFLSVLLSDCFPEASVNTHSFYIGGASTAASVGTPDSAIQILGRWSSNALRRYLQFPDDTIAEFSQRMASAWALRRQEGVRGQKNMLILFERFHRCGVNAFYGMSKFCSVQKLSAVQCVGPFTFL